jgi:predicted molibdopterin-dependent oxidoreductase YjgC
VIGLDGSVSHPLLEHKIRKAFRSGRKVISADIFPSRTTWFSNCFLQYLPGKEISFLQSLMASLESRDPEEEAATMLLGSSAVVIICGDDMLRGPDALEALNALFRLHQFLGRDRDCRILFAGYEGNLLGGVMAGAHPDYLPGYQKAEYPGGLSWNEMISGNERPGVGALMVVGDLPAENGIEKLELLVQCNMFLTGISEQADVVLPVTDFLEQSGHVLTLDRRLKRVNRVVPPIGNTRSITRIIKGLTSCMDKEGFYSSPADLFRELKPFLVLNGVDEREFNPGEAGAGLEGTSPEQPGDRSGFPLRMAIRHNHYRYRGNNLHGLVPDLGKATGNGMVALSESLMNDLNLKNGDPVKIVSANGEIYSQASATPGKNGDVACLIHYGIDASAIISPYKPGMDFVEVRIENV